MALLDHYYKINRGIPQDHPRCPLTVLYPHESVDETFEHLINAGTFEICPTNYVLQELSKIYQSSGQEKAPVLLTSCNETKGTAGGFLSYTEMLLLMEKRLRT
jgi:hypothetical protein